MKKIISIILIAVMSLSLFGCGKGDKKESEEVATNVTVFKVEQNDIDSSVSYTGEIKASEESMVTPKSAGIIRSLNYDIGDLVYEGDVLAELDDTDYRIAYNQALAAYNQAQAAYNSTTNGSLKQSKSQLESVLSSAQIEYNNATDNYNRQKALYDAGAISKVALETAETRMKNAEINLNSANNNLNITINEVNKDAEISARAAVEAASAALDAASNSLNNTVVRAPISGYIASRNATIGQMATQGSPMFTIKSSAEVNAEVQVTESVIPYITVGTEATVSVESAEVDNVVGTVTEVSSVKSDTTGMYTVRVKIGNPDNILKIGMFADVVLNTQSISDAIVIPSESIMQEEDKYYVYVVNNDVAEKRYIETGIFNNEFTEIKSGIKSGEYVVVVGKEYLSEQNNKVRIVEGN